MRFLSIHLPFLATDRIRRSRRPCPPDSAPLATWAKVANAQRLVALDAAALQAGLRPGMALAAARAMRPDLDLVEADPEAEAALLLSVADWLRRFTPLAAADPPDGALLDIQGCAHLFGGEDAMIVDIEEGLAAQGFHARCAIAANPALAFALARFSSTRLLADGDHAAAAKVLRVLPVAALRLDEATIAGLGTAGLTRVGDLLTRPRSPLAARFGAGLLDRIDAIVGRRRDPISPRFEAPPYMTERRFAEGIARREDIEAVLFDLARDLCAMLERHGEGARGISASFFRVDGAVRCIDVGTSRPQREPGTLTRLLREKIDALGEGGLETGYGFDVLRLAATAVERMDGTRQTDLVAASAPQDESEEAFVDLVDRLAARLGTQRVQRLAFQDTHIPEFAAVTRAASLTRPAGRTPRIRTDEKDRIETPARPPRLFEKPEPIEAIATVPDGPPLRFRWRRTTYEVVAYEGPERIAPEWWRDAGLTRDYFRVEDKAGSLFWVFREGLFGQETSQPRWFVHGVFG